MNDGSTAGFRHFEDFAAGDQIRLPPYRVTRDEIVAFAGEFDPQPMHLDEGAAAKTLLGGLAASGWHTCAMMMRMICDGFLVRSSSLGSPGIEELRWLKPVRPGDELSAVAEVVEARASKSRPEMGIVKFVFTVTNQAGETVMTMRNPILFGRRAAA